MQPRPLAAQPRPLVAQPRPLVAQPRPLVAQPRPLVAQPRPLVAQPRPLEATGQPYRLSFYYEGEEPARQSPQIDSRDEQQVDYDGFLVQSFDGHKAARYAKDAKEHGSGCILSAFLYFITITSFVYLSVLWIKQRAYLHIEQMQWW